MPGLAQCVKDLGSGISASYAIGWLQRLLRSGVAVAVAQACSSSSIKSLNQDLPYAPEVEVKRKKNLQAQ